ncbi:MAG: ribosomal protein L11 methyltransferase [Verrucomicrobiales bacterium]
MNSNGKKSQHVVKFRWFRAVPVAEADVWEDRLFATGLENLALSNSADDQKLLLEGFFESRDEAERFQAEFEGQIEEFADQNWVALGEADARRKSIRIRDRFVVTLDDDPGFLDELRSENPGADLLIFPPEMAFGTGDHETTSTCLEMLVENSPAEPWSFLDLGTGTGILAVAASFLGASRIVGTDFDSKAIEVAQGSLARNGVSANSVELREQDVLAWEPDEQFDLVAANLFSTVLIEAMPGIRASVKDGGQVILSGILREQLLAVETAAKDAGLTFERVVERGKWASVHCLV